ncbi:PhzF family phenazine biosynthesis protein [Actinophytocola algeriensis]|uniref:PhzF family phenazine biosynthesis protein n=1 Tax=Actinophytocola algeriensis TaxID=1768010 RepID=A0A7W7Q789_9PSEU|nr:PhzF family phenazine biosynthesis isomerase [Actinophytocola algeriensis]MBB4907984.1 PhzF family phenazine biosynthesis protein [Actinophytocola algeriensis]MBE1480014.1 PhzF family phenazine biosynthesis protein [Actinophytocola algeriensis]
MVLRYAAFTTDPTTGNPAGVVLDAAGLPDAEMQRIAAEVGYSETAFVTGTGPRYAVRYFSPLAEVPFCGHATIATAVALADRDGQGELVFDTQAGEIPVRTEGRTASLTSVPTRSRPASPTELAGALSALRWSPADVDPSWPAHVAFAGNDHLVLAARSRDRLAELDYDFPALQTLMAQAGWTTVHLFWRAGEREFHARDPFPPGGVVEDPATGAAAAAFGGYLRALDRAPAEFTIIQGEDMGRRSELTVRTSPDDARITVSGTATLIPS